MLFRLWGTGVGGFLYGEAARIMVEEVAQHLATPTTLLEVIFVLYETEAFQAFQEEVAAKGLA